MGPATKPQATKQALSPAHAPLKIGAKKCLAAHTQNNQNATKHEFSKVSSTRALRSALWKKHVAINATSHNATTTGPVAIALSFWGRARMHNKALRDVLRGSSFAMASRMLA